MNVRKLSAFSLLAFSLVLLTPLSSAAQVVQEYVTGLLRPIKLLAIPGGGLLVAEAGLGPNTGRVSYVDRGARRFLSREYLKHRARI